MIRNEIKRSICSKAFLFALVMMTLFAALSALYYIESWSGYNPEELNHYVDAEGNSKYSPDFAIMSLFSAWLGGDMLSLAYTVFFTLIPIGAAIPFAQMRIPKKRCYKNREKKILVCQNLRGVFKRRCSNTHSIYN